MPALDIARLGAGDRIQHELLVFRAERRETREGVGFVLLELGNATGRIVARVWSEHEPEIRGVRPGQVIQVIGAVESFRGQLQLRLTTPPRVIPSSGVDVEAFLPAIPQSLPGLWESVDRARAELGGELRQVVDACFADDVFRSAFEKTPGSLRGRLAARGGLLLHTVELLQLCTQAARVMGWRQDLAAASALLHDAGRIEFFEPSLLVLEPTRRARALGAAAVSLVFLERRLGLEGIDVEQPSDDVAFVFAASRLLSSDAPTSPARHDGWLDLMIGAHTISLSRS